jgi:sulfide:quinone oxidoreductase
MRAGSDGTSLYAMTDRHRILILGSGFAGLETAFLLRMRMREAAELTLVSERPAFTFRPNAIYVPFGADPADLVVELAEPFARRKIEFVEGRVTEVDPIARTVLLAGGAKLGYDKLVVATGAQMAPQEIPGLAEQAATIWTPASMLDVRARFDHVLAEARRGRRSRVLFLVPPNNKCAGPLYEIVMMFDTWLRRHGARHSVEITWSTFEHSFIQAFGPRLHEVVGREFEGRAIDGHTSEVVVDVAPGAARYADGRTRAFDHLIAFPPYVSAVRYRALPSDERGFIQTELATRQVVGLPDIYAPGDAGDFPVKQAFLAFLQADTVAEHIAALAGGHGFEKPFDPVSMCIMEMFDKATFAQVPLELTGDPARPVTVRAHADGAYKVGTGATWRLGKKLLGMTVPMRFHAGEPFHAGLGWQMMDIGLKGMSAVMTD